MAIVPHAARSGAAHVQPRRAAHAPLGRRAACGPSGGAHARPRRCAHAHTGRSQSRDRDRRPIHSRSMAFEQITVEVSERILTITLNRPERLNAWTPTMAQELIAAFDRADADDEVRAVIVTGAGRGFCAGADLAGGGETFDRPRVRRPGSIVVGHPPRRRRCGRRCGCSTRTKPIIAAINGPAVGVGATMTLPMDIRLAAEDARSGSCSRAAGSSPRRARAGSCPASSASAGRSSGSRPAACSPRGRRLEGGLLRSLHPDGRAARARRARSGARSPRTPRRCRSPWRGGCCGACSAPSTRCSPTAPTRAGCSTAASPPTRPRASPSFLEKRAAAFPERVSDGLPEILPGWVDPAFE